MVSRLMRWIGLKEMEEAWGNHSVVENTIRLELVLHQDQEARVALWRGNSL